MPKKHPGFSLGELITTAADEIRAARKDTDKDAVMKFEGCTLELSVTIGAEGEGGIKFWVVNASTKANAETVSKITLPFGAHKKNIAVFNNPTGDLDKGEGPPAKPRERP